MNAKQKAFVDWTRQTISHWNISTSDGLNNEISVKISTGEVIATVAVNTEGRAVSSLITGKNCAFAAAQIYPNLFVAERLATGMLQLPQKDSQ